MDVIFQAETPYKLACVLLQNSENKLSITFDPQIRVIRTAEPTLVRMLNRLGENKAVVLPYFAAETHSCMWVVLAKTARELDHTVNHVKSMIVPTYANFTATDGFKQFQVLEGEDDFQVNGQQLYPAGYYTWHSSKENRVISRILERLNLWLDLEESRPVMEIVHRQGYTELYTAFITALAANDWSVAEQILQEIQRLGLGTAENLAFLKVRLLAQQQSWQALWDFKDFARLAQLKVPRPIRADLLSAFYYSQLQPSEQEQNWAEALTIFKGAQPKLGLLLTSRIDLTQAPVLLVFAYQAVAFQDVASLKQLLETNPDEETRNVIAELIRLLPDKSSEDRGTLSQTVDEVEDYVEPTYLVRQALQAKDYDKALDLTTKITKPGERVLLCMQIAAEQSDALLAAQEIAAFQILPLRVQTFFRANDPTLTKRLERLQQLVDPSAAISYPITTDTEVTGVSIENWLEWLDRMTSNPDDAELSISVERLNSISDERLWTLETIALLDAKLQNLGDNSRVCVKLAIQSLSNFFLLEPEFPRSASVYTNLYGTLYICLLSVGDHSLTTGKALLRLAEAHLNAAPQEWQSYYQDFATWCAEQPSQTPILRLEEWVTEALELLLDYGTPTLALGGWYRQWIGYLLQRSGGRPLSNLELWSELGKEVVPGDILLTQLEPDLAIEESQQADDPIALLQNGYQIGIFSLRDGSAKRVQSLLNKRNPEIKIKICSETDLNDAAKSIAQNSNMVIIVTGCITHALTYGISPFLKAQKKEPVYPQSSGSTSIIRAIENSFRLRQS